MTTPAIHTLGYSDECTHPVLCGQWIVNFAEDAVRVNTSARLAHNTIIDSYSHQDAHRDAFQLIPTGSIARAQYAAGLLGGVEIVGNHIRSLGALQGIFCSDGYLTNILIQDNVIQTKSQHYITLSGLQSGWISGNLKEDGTSCPILLTPLRIGGNTGEGNLWILGFADEAYDYWHLDNLVDQESQGAVMDKRQSFISPNDIHLTEFDLEGFWVAAEALDAPNSVIDHCKALKKLALMFGSIVT